MALELGNFRRVNTERNALRMKWARVKEVLFSILKYIQSINCWSNAANPRSTWTRGLRSQIRQASAAGSCNEASSGSVGRYILVIDITFPANIA